jgi:hypothetical protein
MATLRGALPVCIRLPFVISRVCPASCWSLAVLLVGVSLAATASASIQVDFENEYDTSNWTIYTEGDGSVDISGAPLTVSLTSSDTGSGDNRIVDFSVAAAADGLFSFDWDYLTNDNFAEPVWDPAFYFNNTLVQLTTDFGSISQSGSVSVLVSAGDTIGWRIAATDDQLGSATLTISAFSAPVADGVVPEPMSFLVWGVLAIAAGTVVSWRRR